MTPLEATELNRVFAVQVKICADPKTFIYLAHDTGQFARFQEYERPSLAAEFMMRHEKNPDLTPTTKTPLILRLGSIRFEFRDAHHHSVVEAQGGMYGGPSLENVACVFGSLSKIQDLDFRIFVQPDGPAN